MHPQIKSSLYQIFTSHAIQGNELHMLRFLMQPKYMSKLSQKLNFFLPYFKRLFVYALLHPLSSTLIFCKLKDLIKVHNCGKFHLYSVCGCQVKNFQSLAYQTAAMQGSFLRRVLGSFSHKFVLTLLKFAPEISRQKHCLKNLWKMWIFMRTGRTKSLHFWSNYEPPLFP